MRSKQLAYTRYTLDVDWHAVLRPTALKALSVHKELCPHVASLRLFPGITTASVKAFLTSEIRGVGAYRSTSTCGFG